MNKRHTYEIEPRAPGKVTRMLKVQGGEVGAELAAREMLADNEVIESVGIYHTWPSPGPVRRFVKRVTRDD